ncbi:MULTISPECIES: dTDP-4-dehydrorhamnose reductase [Gammaproteobacteria]|jgi:dTDP-4-dehydrorhamnose reductase|uniref:dTDP-4-dehydrorhamnose reductase n=1 Tax=Gammaproteobacteria TaxID=1236 RepID=UPI000C508C50|nr:MULTISPECIES: dTDP-4-dehydrorhamnose reductase [Gammaproteobacteria]MBU73753.1 dTDP-4-dehydrorhamnose reductase [Spongiibacter sp.]HCP20353.1 dTDP-4-dehydrorhamnose reductase [Marinobacter nauticus]|tara:strand:- start:12 stop:884 length:873 start_codon:yes stop_codon:yes gene_type:complete
MNILLLGKTGQVGFELHRTLSPLGTITAPGREKLDLTNEQAVTDYLAQIQPNLIVNAAAYTAVDAAEENQQAAQRLNAGLPKQLAEYAKANNARLVHYSSDYVYPGTGSEAWQETSPTGPLSVYGQTKLEGDQAIEQSGAGHLIFRTSWVYSARGNNFMKTMLRLAQSKEELSIVADQVGAPTPARLIAQVTALAIHGQLKTGLYHLAPRGETSWHGFAQDIFRQAQRAGETLSMGPDNARAIPTSDYPTPAKRPLNSRMALSKLENALNIQLPDWQSQLTLTLNEYLEK